MKPISALAAASPVPLLEKLLQDEVNRALLRSLSDFARVLALHGYMIPVHSPNSLVKLATTPAEHKIRVREYFDLWRSWVSPNSATEPMPITDPIREISYAKRALTHFGMEASEDFWKMVEGDEVIELYDTKGIQLYRSMTFFKYCGYSLLDISVNEWFVLWERPRMVLEHMTSFTQEVLSHYVSIQKMPFPLHVVRESMETGMTHMFRPRAFVQDFRYMGSLKRGDDLTPCGTILTSRVELVAEGSEAFDIRFV